MKNNLYMKDMADKFLAKNDKSEENKRWSYDI